MISSLTNIFGKMNISSEHVSTTSQSPSDSKWCIRQPARRTTSFGFSRISKETVATAQMMTPCSTPQKRKRAPFECVICLNAYRINVPHGTDKCQHQICRDCVRKYFNSTLKDTRYMNYEYVQCPSPGCTKLFVTAQALEHFFSKAEAKKWWDYAVMKSYVKNKITCPFPGCHAVYDADDKLLQKCAFTVCYECHRGFCAACQKPWHPGEIRIVDDEQELIQTLKKAEQNNWCRCPKCSRIVEKVSGCSTIRCLCNTFFCYRCGGESDDHYCRNRCQEFNQERLNAIRTPMFDLVLQKKKVKRN